MAEELISRKLKLETNTSDAKPIVISQNELLECKESLVILGEADKGGVYLVLWFGKQTNRNKILKGLGRGIPLPKSSEELRAMLIERSIAAREGRIVIFVMDITKPE